MNQKTRVAKKLLAFFVLSFAFLSFAGCERGCLMREAREHGVTPSSSVMTPMTRGQDCAPDLYRCRGGSLERSLVGFVPENCEGTIEQCRCPWMHTGDCANGALCAKEDLEIALTNDAGANQLCAAPATDVTAIIGGAIPERVECDEPHEVVCTQTTLVRCDSPLKLLATCTHGCAVRELPSDVDDRVAVAIACVRK